MPYRQASLWAIPPQKQGLLCGTILAVLELALVDEARPSGIRFMFLPPVHYYPTSISPLVSPKHRLREWAVCKIHVSYGSASNTTCRQLLTWVQFLVPMWWKKNSHRLFSDLRSRTHTHTHKQSREAETESSPPGESQSKPYEHKPEKGRSDGADKAVVGESEIKKHRAACRTAKGTIPAAY